ncbi:MAG: ParB/RepB/Spo0J family partition protein, partial [Deltaproteobacteria bacterium]|nr:ParB/RepB/Spo0J family partition protein [Deltaproteobacteria bacterium]
MPKRQANIKLDYKHRLIDVNEIDPSPFQVRKFFDDDKQKELAESIKRDGLIEPIVVRRKGRRYEIIAGERRFRAVRDFTEMKNIPAQIVKATDLEARRMSTAENLQREDLSAIETIEAIVEIVDAELIEDKQYAAMGKNPADRVKTLLGKLDSVRRSQERGSSVSKQSKSLSHK